MICKNCKQPIPRGTDRCPSCGQRISPASRFFSALFDKLRIPLALILLFGLIAGIFFLVRTFTGPKTYDRDMGTYTPDETHIVYEDGNDAIGYVDNMILIYFTSGADDDDIRKIIDHIGGQVVGIMPGINQFQVQVKARNKDELKQLRDQLLLYDEVKFVQIDYVVNTAPDAVIPDDPWIDDEGLRATWDENDPADTNWWVEATRLPSAWEYQDAFQRIPVGVADGGCDPDHEDLQVTIVNADENDADSHGTAVCGVIGASWGNGVGISGAMTNVDLYSADFYESDEQAAKKIAISSMFDALNGCVQNGCKVVNMSSGLNYDTVFVHPDISESTARMAVEYLLVMKEAYDQDFIIVQSSGNGNGWGRGVDAFQCNGYFCSIDLELAEDHLEQLRQEGYKWEKDIDAQQIMDSIMVIASIDCERREGSYQLAASSNYGDSVTVAAPGVHILTTAPNNAYRYANGTSFAAPLASGVTALVWSVNPDMTSRQVKEIITSTATVPVLPRTPGDEGSYYIIDAAAAVEKAISMQGTDAPESPVTVTSDFGIIPDPAHFIAGMDYSSDICKFVKGGHVNFSKKSQSKPATVTGPNPQYWWVYRFDKSLDAEIEEYLQLLEEGPFHLELIHQEQSNSDTYYFYRYNGSNNVYALDQSGHIPANLGEYHIEIRVNDYSSKRTTVELWVGLGLETVDPNEYESILNGADYQRSPDPIVDLK